MPRAVLLMAMWIIQATPFFGIRDLRVIRFRLAKRRPAGPWAADLNMPLGSIGACEPSIFIMISETKAGPGIKRSLACRKALLSLFTTTSTPQGTLSEAV